MKHKEDAKQSDFLEANGLRVERKYNLCGYFEYHVLNQANETIAKNTVQKFAIDSAVNSLKS
ncbi:hypothetical protein [Acinetobacter haemolyticus]|uniref:hypothetical protein n=1 Tax=Acinetobacter haemolyticus TaxID=29430 RepID=UPI000F746F0C|nr:hypothetical protein [Acinetobacter haemolyticus]RSN77919.1 hypothetical protein EA769_03615 [Acinetobacter haemolyticus]